MTKRPAEDDGQAAQAANPRPALVNGLPDLLQLPPAMELPTAAAFAQWHKMPFGLQPPALAGDVRNAFMASDVEAPPEAKLRLSLELKPEYVEWLRTFEDKHRAAWEATRKGDASWQWQALPLHGESPRLNMNVMLGRGARGQQRRTVVKVIPPALAGEPRVCKSGVGWAFLAPLMREHFNFQGGIASVIFDMTRYEVKGKDDENGKAGISFRLRKLEIGLAAVVEPDDYVPCDEEDQETLTRFLAACGSTTDC